jgi:uncharacterized protein (TIGR03382 family)
MTTSIRLCSFVAIFTVFATSIDAIAVPFFSRSSRASLPTIQAENGTQPGLMTGYTTDVQSGVGDFVFLARNFAGGNSSGGGKPSNGLIGPLVDPIGVVTPAPTPGSMTLLAVGGAVLLWRRRHGWAKPFI